MLHPSGKHDSVARRTDVDELFANEETWGRAAYLAWARHPATRQTIDRWQPAARTATAPLARFLADQLPRIRFCAQVFSIAGYYPDGSLEPNPFDPATPDAWPLTPDERAISGYVAAAFAHVTELVLAELAAAGVPVDAGAPMDQANVGQLLITAEIPWDLPTDEFAAMMQPFGLSGIDRDGRRATHRDGRPIRTARNIEQIRQIVRTAHGAAPKPMAYRGGSRRATPKPVLARREALRIARDRFPTATPATILQTFDHGERTPGGLFRRELRQRIPTASKPNRSTLHNDLKALAVEADM